MREILFKAKRIDNGEWVEGFYVKTAEAGYIVVPYKRATLLGEGSTIEVNPDTLCQFTGLTDKNGNKIWENDVVMNYNAQGDAWNISKIVFGHHSLNYGWCQEGVKKVHRYCNRLFNTGFSLDDTGKCEVIGNIFDNSELIN